VQAAIAASPFPSAQSSPSSAKAEGEKNVIIAPRTNASKARRLCCHIFILAVGEYLISAILNGICTKAARRGELSSTNWRHEVAGLSVENLALGSCVSYSTGGPSWKFGIAGEKLGRSSEDYKTCRAPGIQSNACAVIQLNSNAKAKVVANFMPAGTG
jgi:hypothetical protein